MSGDTFSDMFDDTLTDNKNITPASAEAVARAIAEAQHKLSSSQMEPPQHEINPDNVVSIVVNAQIVFVFQMHLMFVDIIGEQQILKMCVILGV